MATNFPTNKDNFTNPKATDPVVNPSHADQHADANDAIEALQDKVGIDNSTDNITHDFKLSEVADGDKAVSKTAEQTLTNKTLTTPVINEIETPTGKTLSYNDATDILVNRNSEETLTNKTLTSPKVNELTDTNGNETIETPATASAINNLEVKNASAGNDVELNAKGGDTDIDIRIKGKGSGKVKVGNNPISFPNTPGSTNQALLSDGAGNLSFGDVVSTDNPLISAATYLFARQQETPDLTLRVEAGNAYFGNQAVQFPGGNSPSFTAPTTNPRIDVLSLDSDGILVRTAGTEATSPTAPAIPAGNIPIAQIVNLPGQTQINDSDQSDGNGYIQKDLRPFIRNQRTDIQEFSSTGIWTKPYGANLILIEIWGAGGSGAAVSNSSNLNTATGGSGGAYRRFVCPAEVLNSTEDVIIGLGGEAIIKTDGIENGQNGQNSSFKNIVANGGKGGTQNTNNVNPPSDPGIAQGGDFGANGGSAGIRSNSSSTEISSPGGAGEYTDISSTSTGGISFLGPGVGGNAQSTNAGNANGTAGIYGGGGGGAVIRNTTTHTATSGKGGDGFARITTFF